MHHVATFILVCDSSMFWGLAEKGYAEKAGMTHFYHFFYEGCLANFEIGDDAEEACTLYPDLEYIKVEDYLKQYL